MKDKFDTFCAINLNIAIRHKNRIGSHPVNKNALLDWSSEMNRRIQDWYLANNPLQYKTLTQWVTKFAANLQNVSAAEFFKTMDQVIDDLILKIQQDRPSVVIFCPLPQVGKSGLWLAILYWNRLKNWITHVLSTEEANEVLRKNPLESGKIFIIYMDDASFSGQQASQTMVAVYNYLKDRELVNVTQLFAIPYISKVAISLFNQKFRHQIWISSKTIRFQPIKVAIPLTDNLFFWRDFFRDRSWGTKKEFYIPTLHTIYFDHKLPDHMSVYVQIIAYSPLIPSVGQKFIIENVQIGTGFITGCEPRFNERTRTPGEILNMDTDMCPEPVYKALGYVFVYGKNGTQEFKDTDDEVFDYICINCANIATRMCGNCKSTKFCGKKCQRIFMGAGLDCCGELKSANG
jgi:hypothetical protein